MGDLTPLGMGDNDGPLPSPDSEPSATMPIGHVPSTQAQVNTLFRKSRIKDFALGHNTKYDIYVSNPRVPNASAYRGRDLEKNLIGLEFVGDPMSNLKPEKFKEGRSYGSRVARPGGRFDPVKFRRMGLAAYAGGMSPTSWNATSTYRSMGLNAQQSQNKE